MCTVVGTRTSCSQCLEFRSSILREIDRFYYLLSFFDRYIHIIIIHDSLVTELVFQLYISISVLHFFATIL